ncbi:unnamed protein product [Hymenolepis diminuta]|uniref:Amiloride-sensitive sodium channel n=2 Tax=Hymenolepis diminuta TaxID=6216 RepID=A0A0R3SVH1_HYMDI|nr:unnamed protein product [Hymenolepis diminuta]
MWKQKSSVRKKNKKDGGVGKNKNKPGWIFRAKSNCRFFLESTSIRGCSRIVRSETHTLRWMWAIYLCSTTLFLIGSILKLVTEYMKYSVNIQTYNEMDAPMDFPTVTFCNHQPFSERAYELWKNGSVISPTRFNQLVRHRAAELFARSIQIPLNDNGTVRILNKSLMYESLRQGIVYDSLPLYYQSVQWPSQIDLGHDPKDLIALCLFQYGNQYAVTGPGCEDAVLRVKRLSDPKFFNCYSVEIIKEFSKSIKELGLILWLGPDENHGKEDRQAFLFDLFEQAYGIKVSIHEPGQMVNLDKYSFQIAPGRMNELTFQTVKIHHYDRPPKPCTHNPTQIYTDLNELYNYQFEVCLNSHLQRRIVEECGCLYAYYPRIYEPNKTLPYCGRLIDDSMRLMDMKVVEKHEHCAEGIVKNAAAYRKAIEDSETCKRRCVSVEYESQVSVTKWRATAWQLYWSLKTSSLFDSVANGSLSPPDARLIEHFLRTPNLADFENSTSPIVFDERYTYLLVRRKSNDTIIKEENLVLTVNALFSRIGGLCSLYIGLTLAVLMEIVEFIYISWVRRKEKKKSSDESSEQNEQNSQQSPTEDNHTEKTLLENNKNDQKSNDQVGSSTSV